MSSYLLWTRQTSSKFDTSHGPTLATFDKKLYMAWKGKTDENIYYAYTNNGTTWSAQQKAPNVLTSNGPAIVACNAVHVGNNQIYLNRKVPVLLMVWKGMGTDDRIWYTTFDGSSWSPQKQVPGVLTSHRPALAIYKDTVYMVWKGNGTNDQIWYTTFNGTKWKTTSNGTNQLDQQLTNNDRGTSCGPALAEYDYRPIIGSNNQKLTYALER